MKAREIRETFLKYFEGQGHQRIKSSPLIPASDPTLLFTNAGMVQFKDYFLGIQKPPSVRAATVQKCVRAGGKHNDLENVGFTPRHHTFFEMLGNFSFGDYFKKDAIAFAWELLTKKLNMPEDRLRITVFETDDEAEQIWKSIGVNPSRIERLGEKDNFWAMGDTGPCGPCSEIYFDWGMEHASIGKDGTPGTDSTRFVEIWNLVFMQFNRSADGKMVPLPKPSVDTGAGLERVAAVMQGKYSNFDTDMFKPIFSAISAKVGMKYEDGGDAATSMRVIADHLRAGTFLLSDGVTPSNEGRGYVLRRILRRAIRHGKKLNQEKPFLYDLMPSVINEFSDVYPELKTHQANLQTEMREEEERFHETLHRGMGVLEDTLAGLTKGGSKVIPGAVAFKLYDTFGFPYDLIEVIAREKHFSVDEKEFTAQMEKQRAQSGVAKVAKGFDAEALTKTLSSVKATEFLGYSSLFSRQKLTFLADETGAPITALAKGQVGLVVFEASPCYGESGGQAGDKGSLVQGTTKAAIFNTTKLQNKWHIHFVKVTEGTLKSGEGCDIEVNAENRKATAVNHTATHLLHAALRKILGDRVKQAGSLVDGNRLRFDFSYPRSLTPEEKAQIEALVNTEVAKGTAVSKSEMGYDEAIKAGALAFFDDKYGDKVRVIRVGGDDAFSVELCGGTHLDNISDIGFFKILSESSVASGVRRIEAITATKAIGFLTNRDAVLREVESTLNVNDKVVAQKVADLMSDNTKLNKELQALKVKLAQSGGGSKEAALHERAKEINGFKVVAEKVANVDPKILRTLVDQVRDKLKDKTIILLACEADGKASLCLGLSKDLVPRLDAGQLIRPIATTIGGTGGGRNDFAQAGGTNVGALTLAIEQLIETVKGL